MLRNLWSYRYFIWATVKSDLQGRFARSSRGALWFILHPLAQALIFALVLSKVLGAKLPHANGQFAYATYLLAGMAGWGLFAEIVNRSMTIFLEQAGLLKKIAFPRLCLPIVVWGSALLNQILLLCAIAVVFAALGHLPGLAWLALPLGIILVSVFAFGVGMLCGIVNVFSRDVAQVMTVVMQLWFWLTPVVYPLSVVPEHLRWIVMLNPMTEFLGIYQTTLLANRWPDLGPLALPALVSFAIFALAFVTFRRASPELVDAL
ncbi:MAG: ABC transporter permease [Pararhizobium sp.]